MNNELKTKLTFFFLLTGFLLLMTVQSKADSDNSQPSKDINESKVEPLPQVKNTPVTEEDEEEEVVENPFLYDSSAIEPAAPQEEESLDSNSLPDIEVSED